MPLITGPASRNQESEGAIRGIVSATGFCERVRSSMSIIALKRCLAFAMGAATLLGAGWGPGRAADLPLAEAPIVQRHRAGPWLYPVDPGPASSSGYYGYYGYDLTGVPYGGLYSEPSTCLFSVPTATGFRTVDACRY